MKMTILISALVAISALLEYFRLVPFYLYPFRGGRTLYSFFGYPNIMAQYLIVTIFWGIAILVSSETKKIRAIALICTMLSVSALLVTFSRGAIISTIMSGLFFSFLYLKIKSNVNVSAKKIIFIVGFLIIACTTSILLSDSASDGKTLIQIKDMFKRGDSYRIMLWSKSFNTFSVTPVTGIGLGNYRFARHIYAHNDVIQLIVETGTVGLGGFLVFIFFLFKKIQRQYAGVTDRERKVLHLGIASGLLATLMHSMVSFNLHSATSSFFFFLSAGILCSQKLTSDRGSQSQSTSIKKNGIALLVTVSLSLLAMYGEYRSVMSHFYFSQAIYYQKRKEVSRSLEYSLKAIQYQPYNAKYLRYAGNMYRRTGQIALAKDYFKKAKLLSLYK